MHFITDEASSEPPVHVPMPKVIVWSTCCDVGTFNVLVHVILLLTVSMFSYLPGINLVPNMFVYQKVMISHSLFTN